jgi:DNA-binding NarL/FixJ family response regulator
MNGLDCLRAVREQNLHAKIILCSATITEQLTGDYSQLGVTEILAKPMQLSMLARAVKQAMGDDPAKS